MLRNIVILIVLLFIIFIIFNITESFTNYYICYLNEHHNRKCTWFKYKR